MKIQESFITFSEFFEYYISRWWAFISYCLLSVFCYIVWGWDGIDRWIYVVGGIVVILVLNDGRRDSAAIHKKLDSIVKRLDGQENN